MALRWLVLVLCWVSTPAWAGTVWLEGPPMAAKADAATMQAQAAASGLEARVVRRYRAAAGWEYVVVIEGFPTAAPAREAAAKLAAASGRPVSIFETEGEGAKVLGAASPDPAPTAMLDDAAGATASRALLAKAVAAHGAGAALVERSDTVRFEFRRKVPAGPTAKHVYARRDGDLYLQVDIERGEGTGSKTHVVEERAWIETVGAGTPEDVPHTRDVVGRFAPETVIAFALEFGRAAGVRGEFADLRPAGDRDVVGTRCDVLARSGDRSSPALELAIDRDTGLVRQVVHGRGAARVVHEFTDYRTLDGVVVPMHIRAWRGDALVDDVDVLELDLGAPLPDAWFQQAPG